MDRVVLVVKVLYVLVNHHVTVEIDVVYYPWLPCLFRRLVELRYHLEAKGDLLVGTRLERVT